MTIHTIRGKMKRKNKPSTRSQEMTGLEIPPEKNEVPQELWENTLFLYGEKGVGKTSLAAQFPKSVILMFDPGRRNLAIRQVSPQSWEEVKGYLSLCLKSSGDQEVQTIVIDNVDRCYALCQEYICKIAGVQHPNDIKDYGKTWHALRNEFESTFNDILGTKQIIFISHSKTKEITPLQGESYDMVGPSCSEGPWSYMRAVADYVIYYGYFQENKGAGPTRCFTIRGSNRVYASCGDDMENYPRFCSPEGEPLYLIDAGSSSKQAYANLIASYKNKLPGILWEPPKGILGEDDEETELELPKGGNVKRTGKKVRK